ncbi:elongation factor G [Bacillota bacterium LX-D]|nr:elongation factor G [Bacillota bacterium LX-D]
MKVYESGKIRNVGIVAHGGAGKTSLTEAFLFNAGVISRLGKVDEGNTTTDYLPEEIKRKITIKMALAPLEWQNSKINFLDTPGYADFIGDVKGTLRVADSLIFTVCAVSGVEVQTQVIWDYAEENNLPRLFYINKMDRENADFSKVLDELQVFTQDNGKRIIPVQIPIGAENSFKGIIDIINLKALLYEEGTGKFQEAPIPTELENDVTTLRLNIIEAAAEGDDDLLIKYLDGAELTTDEIKSGLRNGIITSKVVPVLCGSALKNIGISPILDFIVEYFPSPLDAAVSSEVVDETLAALVFKTLADPYVGKISFLKVFNGTLKPEISVYNSNKENEEKIGQLFTMVGKQQHPVSEIKAGDIVTLTKLQFTATGDTLTNKQNPKQLEGIDFPEPNLPVAIQPKSKGDEDKLGNAIARLLEEDPTLRVKKDLETKETLLIGLGETHLDITLEKLHRKFGVDVEMATPKIPYRETIKVATQKIEGKHKKQSGGHGQYGHVFIDLAPIEEKEFEFEETIFGGSVPKQYIPAVEKGIKEAMTEGIVAGYPVTNVKVTLTDGSYHPVDSSEMAFKIAASLAFRKALEKAKPVLLEPYMQVEVTVPEKFMGDIIGDFNAKRGRILGMEPKGKYQIIRALAPLSEMYKYAIDLKSITQGRGSFTMAFAHYEEVPSVIANKIIEASKVAKTS